MQNSKSLTGLGRVAIVLGLIVLLSACSNPQPGPDKTAAGMVLGAGWGAGAGAVIGNQVSTSGEGAAVGAGFGAVSGALAGMSNDLVEGSQLTLDRQLASLKVQNLANRRELARLQDSFDQAIEIGSFGGMYQVFFDDDATSLRAGAVANLEVITETLKQNRSAYRIHVVGHADDSGNPEYNKRVAEARARSVSAYLGSRGISMDQISVKSFGSSRPIASNATDVGRQLNRRVDIFVGPHSSTFSDKTRG